MINLLPPEEKQKLFLEKKEKLIIVLGFVILFYFISLILILLSIKFYVLADVDYQKNILSQAEKKDQSSNFIIFNNIIKKYNETLAQLDSFYEKKIYFSQILKIISDVSRPDGLYLTSFSLARDADRIIKVKVSGISNTRDNLLVFKKNIEELPEKYPNVKNPYFSPESWVSPKKVNFSLMFEIK